MIDTIATEHVIDPICMFGIVLEGVHLNENLREEIYTSHAFEQNFQT
jgi:hypothetical protein